MIMITFLSSYKGLNDSFDTVKSQVLMMDPLTSMNKVFSLVIQQEKKIMPIVPAS